MLQKPGRSPTTGCSNSTCTILFSSQRDRPPHKQRVFSDKDRVLGQLERKRKEKLTSLVLDPLWYAQRKCPVSQL